MQSWLASSYADFVQTATEKWMLRRHDLTAVLSEHASYTLSPHLSVIFLEPWGLGSMAQMLHPRAAKQSLIQPLTWVLEVKLRVLIQGKYFAGCAISPPLCPLYISMIHSESCLIWPLPLPYDRCLPLFQWLLIHV